ncbi:MAG: DUF6161 domain-containing protein [Verrucomicrobiota bacterium]
MSEPFLKVKLEPNGADTEFETWEDFTKWFSEEQKIWEWLNDYRFREFMSSDLQRQYSNYFDAIRSRIQAIDQQKENPQHVENHKRDIQSLIKDNYENRRILYSKTPDALMVLKLKEDSVIASIAALAYFLGIKIERGLLGERESYEGIIRAFCHANGIKFFKDNERTALRDLLKDGQERINKFSGQLRNEIESTIASRDEKQSQFNQLKEQHEQFSNTTSQEWKDFSSKLQTEWDTIKKTYEEQLGLQAPVQYWKKKDKGHFWQAIIYGVLTLAFAANYFYFLVWPKAKTLLDCEKVDYGHVVLIFFLFGLGAWLIRVLLKLMMSHFHLQADAKQRATMVETYLALDKEGTAVPKEHRALILEAIFRPVTMGMIKEDQPSSMPFDYISKHFTG